MKTKYFKKYANPFLYLSVAICLLLAVSCSKDDATETPPNQQGNNELIRSTGVTAEDIGEEQGEIGLLIDTRKLRKKGYLPVEAIIDVTAVEGRYSDTIVIDELTNLGQLSVKVENLSEAALAELREGVPLEITIRDASKASIVTENFSAESFRENGTRLDIDASGLPLLNNELSINPDIPYYIQLVVDGKLTNKVFESSVPNQGNYDIRLLNIYAVGNEMNSSKRETQFNLVPVPGKEGLFYIKTIWDDFYVGDWFGNEYQLHYYENMNELTTSFEYTFEMQDSGNVRIKASNGQFIRIVSDFESRESAFMYANETNGLNVVTEIADFRLIPSTIKWEIEATATRYLDAILPPAKTTFDFNSTLANCTSGSLSQEVAFSESLETVTTVGWEESIELSSETTTSFSATVGVDTSVKFFGSGVDLSFSATSEYSSTKGFTSGNSQYQEGSTSESRDFSVVRTIEVLPGKAAVVYDAYQVYDNIQIPFVKKFRVRGIETISNNKLTGDEIKSQFAFNYFNGVISIIGSDFIEVTLRGVTKVDELVKARNEAQEIAYDCNN